VEEGVLSLRLRESCECCEIVRLGAGRQGRVKAGSEVSMTLQGIPEQWPAGARSTVQVTALLHVHQHKYMLLHYCIHEHVSWSLTRLQIVSYYR
jgi:hypothetical protein